MLDRSSSQKWLGCMLSTENEGKRQDDIDHRLQSAARAFHVHKWILCDEIVSMASRLKFFDAMITSVVCFASGHRKISTTDLRKFDVHCTEIVWTCCGFPVLRRLHPVCPGMMLFSRFHVWFVHSCALNGPPLGIQDQSQKVPHGIWSSCALGPRCWCRLCPGTACRLCPRLVCQCFFDIAEV